MAEKISGIYKITNTTTGDSYIGSSKNIKSRWTHHKCQSTWKRCPNNPMYHDMQKYGVDKFVFEILEEAEPESLKETEQLFIEKMHPTYNDRNANGLDFERQKEYQKSDKYKKYKKEHDNQSCCYNGETLTLCALARRFQRAGIAHPAIEAKKYILNN